MSMRVQEGKKKYESRPRKQRRHSEDVYDDRYIKDGERERRRGREDGENEPETSRMMQMNAAGVCLLLYVYMRRYARIPQLHS